MIPLSVTILSKNSEKYLSQVLDSLSDFDEVILWDTGSTDRTLEIALQYPNVACHKDVFLGFGPTHNKASASASHDWILSIDSDEVLTSELKNEIQKISFQRGCVYSFPRNNYYKGKWIKGCGWYPDRQIRIYHRLDTHFNEAFVHETIVSGGLKEVRLEGALIHYSYAETADFLHKMHHYSDLFAKQYQGKRQSSICKAALHGLFAFLKSYLLKRGVFLGSQGFEISLYNANTAFYKYVKLKEANELYIHK